MCTASVVFASAVLGAVAMLGGARAAVDQPDQWPEVIPADGALPPPVASDEESPGDLVPYPSPLPTTGDTSACFPFSDAADLRCRMTTEHECLELVGRFMSGVSCSQWTAGSSCQVLGGNMPCDGLFPNDVNDDGVPDHWLPDGDGDGVPDVIDPCPGTSPGTTVNLDGCPDRDYCVDTPEGVPECTEAVGSTVGGAPDDDDPDDGLTPVEPGDDDGFLGGGGIETCIWQRPASPGDTDGDGIPNADDVDLDGDGTPNERDLDVDGDCTVDSWDPCLDGWGWYDGCDDDPTPCLGAPDGCDDDLPPEQPPDPPVGPPQRNYLDLVLQGLGDALADYTCAPAIKIFPPRFDTISGVPTLVGEARGRGPVSVGSGEEVPFFTGLQSQDAEGRPDFGAGAQFEFRGGEPVERRLIQHALVRADDKWTAYAYESAARQNAALGVDARQIPGTDAWQIGTWSNQLSFQHAPRTHYQVGRPGNWSYESDFDWLRLMLIRSPRPTIVAVNDGRQADPREYTAYHGHNPYLRWAVMSYYNKHGEVFRTGLANEDAAQRLGWTSNLYGVVGRGPVMLNRHLPRQVGDGEYYYPGAPQPRMFRPGTQVYDIDYTVPGRIQYLFSLRDHEEAQVAKKYAHFVSRRDASPYFRMLPANSQAPGDSATAEFRLLRAGVRADERALLADLEHMFALLVLTDANAYSDRLFGTTDFSDARDVPAGLDTWSDGFVRYLTHRFLSRDAEEAKWREFMRRAAAAIATAHLCGLPVFAHSAGSATVNFLLRLIAHEAEQDPFLKNTLLRAHAPLRVVHLEGVTSKTLQEQLMAKPVYAGNLRFFNYAAYHRTHRGGLNPTMQKIVAVVTLLNGPDGTLGMTRFVDFARYDAAYNQPAHDATGRVVGIMANSLFMSHPDFGHAQIGLSALAFGELPPLVGWFGGAERTPLPPYIPPD